MYRASDLGEIPTRVMAMRTRETLRDARHAEIQSARRGDFEAIAPDLFSDEFKRPIVANLIDTSARDMAAMLAPMPAITCSATTMLSAKAREFADKRTKVARSYVEQSELPLQMAARGADMLNCFGMIVGCVQPDFDEMRPHIQIESSIGAYAVQDRRGRTKEFARVEFVDWFSILADYPQLEEMRQQYPHCVTKSNKLEVVHYSSDTRYCTYIPQMGDYALEDMENPAGFCPYVVRNRPNFEDVAKGAYDDVVWMQIARHRLELLLLEGTEKAVRAPIILPDDVDQFTYGPDSTIRTRNPAGVGRARVDIPAQSFAVAEQLAQEQREGSMSPEARSGSIDASVITGRGVQQLMGSFNSQVAIDQEVLKSFFKQIIAMAFALDEKVFGNVEKEIRGNDSGVPYSIRYKPTRDIKGDHTVDVSYGFAAGLDPNRALVFLLQAEGAGWISKDKARRSMPVDIDAAEEEKKITQEQGRAGIIQGFAALAQSIPQIAASGGDPSTPISQMATFIEEVGKGKSVEEAAKLALRPPEPPPAAPEAQQAPGAAGPEGFQQSGLPAGLQPGLATEGPQGRPDLMQLFGGLTSRGAPNVSATVSRMAPAQ